MGQQGRGVFVRTSRVALLLPSVCVLLFALLASSCGPADDGVSSAPLGARTGENHNVIVLLLDDVGMDKLGVSAEHPKPANTPVMDRLAAEGVYFPNTWTYPVCSPTRVSILTGRYGFRTGVGTVTGRPGTALGGFLARAEEVTLPELLRPAGYQAWAVGKWHVGNIGWDGGINMHPIEWGGFEKQLGTLINVGSVEYSETDWHDWTKNVVDESGYEEVHVSNYATSETVDDALALIEERGSEPFFLWLAFNAPHTPFHVPPAELHTMKGTFCEGNCGAPRKYAAALEAADTEIGRFLESVPADILANTTVLLIGDNGTPPQAVMRPWPGSASKGTVTERGINAPLIAWGAAVEQPGRVSDALVCSVDLYPTVLELAGVAPPADGVPRDGRSFASVLRDEQQSDAGDGPRDWAYSEKFQPNGFDLRRTKHFRTVRNRTGWKVQQYPLSAPGKRWRLFDLRVDPQEERNLYPPKTVEAKAAFDELKGVLASLKG